MEHKIFLGKYRVTPDEVALAAAEPSTVAVTATEQLATARIYRGEEIDSGRTVTVEVIPAGAFKPSVLAKLEAEANAAKQINHINIPALYDFGIEDDQLVYVTEYFDGASAEEWVHEHGPMPTGAVLRIALQVVGAMGASSFHKISHHAINPGNLLLVPGQTPEGDWPLVKVLHFVGVAPTVTTSADTSVASFDKSSHYASPEQLRNGTVDFRSEVYSLGATMWFLLTGAPPLVAQKGPVAMQPTTTGVAIDKLSSIPKRVKRLLAQMLSVDPETRPQDPLAFYRQLQECVVQLGRRESMARRLGVPMLATTSSVAIPGRRRFSPKAFALAALLLLIAGVAAVMVPTYLRHQRVRQAEEPIGVAVGVPDRIATASAVVVQAPPKAQTNEVPLDTSVAKADNATNPLPTAAPDFAPATVPNQVAPGPVQPAETSVATTKKTEQPQVPPPAPEKPVPPASVNPAPAIAATNEVHPPVNPAPADTPAAERPVVANNEVQPAVTAPPTNTHADERPVVAANTAKTSREVTTTSKPAESVHSEKKAPKSTHETEVVTTSEVQPAVTAPPTNA